MKCARCPTMLPGRRQLCSKCRRAKLRRRIRIVIDETADDTVEDTTEAPTEAPPDPPVDVLEQESTDRPTDLASPLGRDALARRIRAALAAVEVKPSTAITTTTDQPADDSPTKENDDDALDDEEHAPAPTVSYSLTELSKALSTPPPQLLSQSSASKQLSTTKSATLEPVSPCPAKKDSSTKTTAVVTELEAETPADDDVALRVLYWNIERFGGEAIWGLPGDRADEVIAALAAVINHVDPHFVVLVEVMAHHGANEVARLQEALNKLDKRWDSLVADGVTGVVKSAPSKKAPTRPTTRSSPAPASGETYAVLYERGIGIEPIFARIGQLADGNAFPTETYTTKDGTVVEFRAPGEFLFQMGGRFLRRDGETWPLAIVAFHAPGPQANDQRQQDIERLVASLAKLSVIADPSSFPDCLICADFNSHPDGFNVLPEPAEHVDIAIDYLETPDGRKSALEVVRELAERIHQTPTTSGRSHSKRDERAVETRARKEVAESVAKARAEEREKIISSLGFTASSKKATREERTRRKETAKVLDDLDESDLNTGEEGLALLREWLGVQTPKQEKTVSDKIESVRSAREAKRKEFLASLKKINPRIVRASTIEDMRSVNDHLSASKTRYHRDLRDVVRDLRAEFSRDVAADVLTNREDAYEPLDPSSSKEASGKFDAAFGGFFNCLSLDTDLFTTRRRSVAFLAQQAAGNVAEILESDADFQFSKYDQILCRAEGQLRRPENKVLPILTAVLSADARTRLFSAKITDDESTASFVNGPGLGVPTVGDNSAFATIDFEGLVNVARKALLKTRTWISARTSAARLIRKLSDKEKISEEALKAIAEAKSDDDREDANPPNLEGLQHALILARALSDHEPMVAGFFVSKRERRSSISVARTTRSVSARTSVTQPAPPPQNDHYDRLVDKENTLLYQPVADLEGGTQDVARQVQAFAAKVISSARRRILSRKDADTIYMRLHAVYHLIYKHLDRDPAADRFVDQPGGVANVGNTCYLAATLQCLAANRPYVTLLNTANPTDSQAQAALRGLLSVVVREINEGRTVIRDLVEVLREALIACGWHYGYGEQDPSELLLLIADQLDFPKWITTSQRITYDDGDPGRWNPTPEHVLPLPIPGDGTTLRSFRDCIAAFAYEDLGEDELGGHDRVEIHRRIQLTYSQVAALVMKRYSYDRTLTGYRARRLGTLLTGMPAFSMGSQYASLTSVIRHIGTRLTTGHYHAYVTRNDTTYCCNDSTVTAIDLRDETMARLDGYMFFYQIPAAPIT